MIGLGDRGRRVLKDGTICVVVVLSLPILGAVIIGARALIVPLVIVLSVVGAPLLLVPSARTWLCRRVGWPVDGDARRPPDTGDPAE